MRPACLVLWLLTMLLPGAALPREPARAPCRDDKACAAAAARGHAVTRLDYWRSALARPPEQRIDAAPPELIEDLTLANIHDGFAEKPRAARLSRSFVRDLQAAMAELPPAVNRLVSRKLAGIYFVENLGGTGYTEAIYDDRSNPVAGFVVLDVSVLGRRANA